MYADIERWESFALEADFVGSYRERAVPWGFALSKSRAACVSFPQLPPNQTEADIGPTIVVAIGKGCPECGTNCHLYLCH